MNQSKQSAASIESRKHLRMWALRVLIALFLLVGVLHNLPAAQAGSTDTTIAFSDPLNVTLSEGVIESEPSIAISPVSPTVFLAGMNASTGTIAVRLSDNSGSNWYDANLPTIGEPTQGEADPVVAFDADGRAFVAGITSDVSCIPDALHLHDIGYTIKSGGVFVVSGEVKLGSPATSPGVVWTDPVIIEENVPGDVIWDEVGDPNIAFQDKPWLAVDTSPSSPFRNRVYLAWTTFYGNHDTIVWFSYSPGPGQPFTSKIPIAVAAPDKWVSFSNLSIGPTGDLYIAWTEGYRDENVVQETLFMRHSSNLSLEIKM
jgi:hypothetical protein